MAIEKEFPNRDSRFSIPRLRNISRGNREFGIGGRITRAMLPLLIGAAAVFLTVPMAQAQSDRPLRIIVFGAHPDDCELEAAGTAARWSQIGYKVKFVSVTNGDIGHHEMAGALLARRRTAEVKRCAEILGIETEVLDIHDGELLPTLENRRLITRKIREWQADVVISHRPNDYHPDHRYTGILVQDAAFMVIVPSFCPDVQALRKNPVFLYTEDDFKKPNPFEPDVVVPIDPVLEKKVACVDALESQFYEWNPWLFGYLDQVPKEKEARLDMDARPDRPPHRLAGESLSTEARRTPGARKREGRQARRGVRGLRIRLAADTRPVDEDLPLLPSLVIHRFPLRAFLGKPEKARSPG